MSLFLSFLCSEAEKKFQFRSRDESRATVRRAGRTHGLHGPGVQWATRAHSAGDEVPRVRSQVQNQVGTVVAAILAAMFLFRRNERTKIMMHFLL